MAGKVLRPSELEQPCLLMNFPFTVANTVPNNVLMTSARPYNYPRAFRQWIELYNKIAEEAVVWLLPHDNVLLQDLPYVANIGAALPHDSEIILLSRFKSEPRRGEELIAADFFDKLGYWTRRPPDFWEGEADLKWVSGRTYIGGHGIRSSIRSYNWMTETFDMDIVPVKMTDEKLYHLDCIVFPLDEDRTLVATDVLAPPDIREMERHVEIIGVPPEFKYDGWTNAIRVGKKIFLNQPPSRESQDACEELFTGLGFEPVFTNLGEFDKSGADLSCLVMHLNFQGRK